MPHVRIHRRGENEDSPVLERTNKIFRPSSFTLVAPSILPAPHSLIMNFNLNTRRKTARQSTPSEQQSLSLPSMDDIWEDLDISSTEYARTRRELMQLINDLRSMGAEALKIDLPSIVVIGGQSAGKSSLVEAVSGVSVPRDSGTCTRCPMECTMSSSTTTWSCVIKLRFDYDSKGDSAHNQKELAFGPIITDRNEVDVWLRRAQAAILNPDLPPESFHRKSIVELRNFSSPNTLKFSRNVVSILIEDPDATDLSFVDLPGLIQNEEQGVLDMVQELTTSYISRPNTILLTTIPMSDDMQNQQSVKLAREADPEGERTIGILTKPDMLGEGAVNARRSWVAVIEGRQHQLKHGYYCVRLPDDAQRAQRLSRSALQRMASEYFDTTSPWSEVADRGRFGIPAFVSDISVLLVKHIKKVLPQLREDVERLLKACLDELGALPKPLTGDPGTEVIVRVNAFCDAFKGVVYGTNTDKTLAHRNRALYTIFGRDIRGTAPDFRPFDVPTKYMPFDAIDAEEDSVDKNPAVPIMGVFDVRKTIKESIAWELPNNIPYEAKTRLISQSTSMWSAPAEKCMDSINDVLDEILQGLLKAHFAQLKVLHDRISDLILPDIEEHKTNALDAVKKTLALDIAPYYTQNTGDLQRLRDRWLGKYKQGRRRPQAYKLPELSVAPDDWPSRPPSMFDDQLTEVQSPFIAQSVQSPNHASKAKKAVLASSSQSPSDVIPKSPEERALEYLAQAGYTNLSIEDLGRLHPDDGFDEELTVMADVRAYFSIAYKRIIDHIPLEIEHTLHQALANRLSGSLLHRLIVDSTSAGNFTERMKELVSEDPAVGAKRTSLGARRTRLQEMKKKLASIAE